MLRSVARNADWTLEVIGWERNKLETVIERFGSTIYQGRLTALDHQDVADQFAKILILGSCVALGIPQFQGAFAQWMNSAERDVTVMPYIQYCFEPVMASFKTLDLNSRDKDELVQSFMRFSSLGVRQWPIAWWRFPAPPFHFSRQKMFSKRAKSLLGALLERENRYAKRMPQIPAHLDEEEGKAPACARPPTQLDKIFPPRQVPPKSIPDEKVPRTVGELADLLDCEKEEERGEELEAARRALRGEYYERFFGGARNGQEPGGNVSSAFKPGRELMDQVLYPSYMAIDRTELVIKFHHRGKAQTALAKSVAHFALRAKTFVNEPKDWSEYDLQLMFSCEMQDIDGGLSEGFAAFRTEKDADETMSVDYEDHQADINREMAAMNVEQSIYEAEIERELAAMQIDRSLYKVDL